MSLVPTFTSLLVHVDLEPRNRGRIELAVALADRFGANLIGVAAEDFQFPIYGDLSATVDTRALDAAQRRVEEDLSLAEALFRQVAGSRERIAWRSFSASPERVIASEARAADLLIIGQATPGIGDEPMLDVAPAPVLIEAGRPVLVVPRMVRTLEARRVLCAWKNSREARRALRDGLPFMVGAEAVIVTTIGDSTDPAEAADVQAYLRGYGIDARLVHEPKAHGSVGETLLSIADGEGADLVVSGAYGHSRLREWVLGGVTRDLLRHAPVCCLLSH